MLQINSTLRIFSRWACKQVVSCWNSCIQRSSSSKVVESLLTKHLLNVIYSWQYRCRYCGALSPPSSAILGLDWLLWRGRGEAEWCECPRLWASARWEYIQTELQEHCSYIWAFIIESRIIYNHCIALVLLSSQQTSNAWLCLTMFLQYSAGKV